MRIFVASAAEHLTDHLPNGEGLIAHALLRGLTERGHEVTACTRSPALSAPPSYRVVRPRRTSPIESVEPLRYALMVNSAYRAAIAAGRFDVAWWMFPQGMDDMFELLPRRLPVVIGPIVQPWPADGSVRAAGSAVPAPGDLIRALIRPLLHHLHRRTVRRAHAMLATPHAASALPLPAHRTSQVPYAVDHRRFKASAVPACPTVLFVGRLTIFKGVLDLLEAFPSVLAAHPGALLRIAGSGPLASQLNERVRSLGIDESVELLGAVDSGQVPSLLASCAVLVAPSDGEPFGMTVLEAMSAARAVVVGDNGGLPYLLSGAQGGRAVRPHDVPALSEALAELLGDRAALEEMGRRNRRRVERHFSLDVVLDQVEAVLQAAVDQR